MTPVLCRQVWFQDTSCAWSFIACGFSDFLRLTILHVGLPRWQYAYTDVGLDPVARQWFRLLAPSRLDALEARGASVFRAGEVTLPHGGAVEDQSGGTSSAALKREVTPAPLDALRMLTSLAESYRFPAIRPPVVTRNGDGGAISLSQRGCTGDGPQVACTERSGSAVPKASVLAGGRDWKPASATAGVAPKEMPHSKQRLRASKLARSKRLPHDEGE